MKLPAMFGTHSKNLIFAMLVYLSAVGVISSCSSGGTPPPVTSTPVPATSTIVVPTPTFVAPVTVVTQPTATATLTPTVIANANPTATFVPPGSPTSIPTLIPSPTSLPTAFPTAFQTARPTATRTPTVFSLAGSIPDLTREWISTQPWKDFVYQDRELAPVISKITVSARRADGTVSVTGTPGAVTVAARSTRRDRVRIMAVDWGTQTCIPYAADGSFSAQLPAGTGNTIIVATVFQASCEQQWNNANAGVMLRVPEAVDYRSPNLPFAISGFTTVWHWIATGQLAGSAPFVQFTLPDSLPTVQNCVLPRMFIYRLFDQQGDYYSQVNVNVSGPALTPTGYPIETEEGPNGYYAQFKPSIAGQQQQCLTANSRYELAGWTNGLPGGWYRARLVFVAVRPDGVEVQNVPFIESTSYQSPFDGETIEHNTEIGYLPLMKVGDAQSPKIPATLLNDTPSWGSGGIRGMVANEDSGRFALSSRRAAQGPFIASPHDPLSGRRVQYLLEPYFPTIAYTGFGFMVPQVPMIAFDDSSLGVLSVTLTKPDGKEAVLAANAPLLQSFISGSTVASYAAEISFAGPGRTYGVTTGLSSLLVDFDQYGKYKIALSGSLKTLWGQDLTIRGTYDIWVAEPLDLKLGVFEGTPLEVGDEWSPVVVVEPGVQADVTLNIDHYVDGDSAKKQTYTAAGKSNQFGYFVADKPWSPQAHGEYMARVTASYTDPVDGKLWMATRAGASIVATPNSPLIGHGERNLELANIAGDHTMRTWFFTKTYDPNCGEAACDPIGNHNARTVGNFPFFRGDVAWMPDMSPITPSISLEDPTNLLASIAPQIASSYNWGTATYNADAPDMKKLSMHTTAGKGGQNRPDAIDSWGYWYTSSLHADGIHVDNKASEVHAIHDHWYGHDSYNCQIGLPCYQAWTSQTVGDRNGDEEGDPKVLFGGAVVKSAQGKQFVPYAAMSMITKGALQTGPNTYTFPDPKGNRICPPYQGAAGGLATCGPLVTIQGQEYDLFVTPTGTRPGSVLEPGNMFVFSGEAWPTLDVALTVTMTSPSGQVRTFTGRATRSGYIDSKGKTFTVTEPGVYTVHVSLTQDRPLPSTGQAPNPPIVADGKTLLSSYGYKTPLSAILGSTDSTYRFIVAETKPVTSVSTIITLQKTDFSSFARIPSHISLQISLPDTSESVRYFVGIQGLVIRDESVSGSPSQVKVELDAAQLYTQGFTNVVLGAESMEITVTGKSGGKWFANRLNLRGVSPMGASPPTIQ